MEFKSDNQQSPARIKVVGVGGAGGNAINRMIDKNMNGIEFIAINTDGIALDHSKASQRIHIGEKETKGLGAGANPKIGEASALESREVIKKHLEGADMIFLTAGMGGGTGTGASPIIAEISKELGILTVAIVSKPFSFEGLIRSRHAEEGLKKLAGSVDTIIVIPNQKLLEVLEKKIQFKEAFEKADEILTSATRGISDIILKHGEIQIDFADVKTIMTRGGLAIMGSGQASGQDRALKALHQAIESPLLEDVSVEGSQGVLVNIIAGDCLQMDEVETIMENIHQSVGNHNNANIIFGTMIDPDMNDNLSVTVVATGFDQSDRSIEFQEKEISSANYERPTPAVIPKKMVKPSYDYQNFKVPSDESINILSQSQRVEDTQDDLDIPAYIRLKKRKPLA